MDNNPNQKPDDNQFANTQNNQTNYFGQNTNNQSIIPPTQSNNQTFGNTEIQIPDDLKGYKISGIPNLQSKYKRANPLVAISISVAITLPIVAILFLINGKSIAVMNSDKLIPTLLLILFPIVGSSLGLNMFLNERKSKERCTQAVTGRCVEVSERLDRDSEGHTNMMYTPTYSYQANGQNYTIISEDSYSRLMKPVIGSNKQILFNPNDPSDALIPKSIMQIMMMVMICGSLIICGLGALYLFINK